MRTEGRAESTLTAQFSGKDLQDHQVPAPAQSRASFPEQLALNLIKFLDKDVKTHLGNLFHQLS